MLTGGLFIPVIFIKMLGGYKCVGFITGNKKMEMGN